MPNSKNQYGEDGPWDALNKGSETQPDPTSKDHPSQGSSFPWESEGGPRNVLNKEPETQRDSAEEELQIQRAWMPHSLY